MHHNHQQRSPKRSRAVVLGAVLAASALIAACGGSDDDSDADTAAATESAESAEVTASESAEVTASESASASESAPASESASAPEGSGESAAPIDNGPITHWQHQSDARAAIVQTLLENYASEGGASVEFESIPYSDYFVRLGAALEAGTGPCVMQIPANILAEFQARGQLAAMPAEVMTTEEMEATFTPTAIDLLDVDGEYYGMPTDLQTMLLFYNDDLFVEAGLDPTKDFATWDEFREAAIALTKADGGSMSQAGVDLSGSPYQWYYTWPTLAYEDGLVNDETNRVNYASDPGYQTWERLTSLITADGVDSPEFLADQSKFGSGLAGMTFKEYTFNGVYELGNPDLNFSVHMPPPVADEQFASTASTSWAYAVSAACENQEGAWNWIEYLTSEAAQRLWIESGGELPSRLALLSDASLASNPAVAVGFESLKSAMPYDSNGWDDAFAIQQAIWDNIVLNGADIKAAVDEGAAAEDALYESKGL